MFSLRAPDLCQVAKGADGDKDTTHCTELGPGASGAQEVTWEKGQCEKRGGRQHRALPLGGEDVCQGERSPAVCSPAPDLTHERH